MRTPPATTSACTSTCVSASGWHMGISSAVRFAAWIPANPRHLQRIAFRIRSAAPPALSRRAPQMPKPWPCARVACLRAHVHHAGSCRIRRNAKELAFARIGHSQASLQTSEFAPSLPASRLLASSGTTTKQLERANAGKSPASVPRHRSHLRKPIVRRRLNSHIRRQKPRQHRLSLCDLWLAQAGQRRSADASLSRHRKRRQHRCGKQQKCHRRRNRIARQSKKRQRRLRPARGQLRRRPAACPAECARR